MMENEEVVKEWIEKAEEDFGFASTVIEDTDYFAQICFHFNQSAEKYLKAFIIANGLEFRKIHDLHLLLKQCKTKDPSFAQLDDDCEYLATFYIETRYPVHWPTIFSKEETEKAYRAAKNIRNFLRKKLKEN